MFCVFGQIHKAYAKTRDLNFSLVGLTGFDVHGKTSRRRDCHLITPPCTFIRCFNRDTQEVPSK